MSMCQTDEVAITPFSCKNPSKDEQPGPPFVLNYVGAADVTANGWRLPKYEIIFAAIRCWWKIPEKQLLWVSIIAYTPSSSPNLACFMWVRADRQEAGPTVSDIKIHVRYRSSL